MARANTTVQYAVSFGTAALAASTAGMCLSIKAVLLIQGAGSFAPLVRPVHREQRDPCPRALHSPSFVNGLKCSLMLAWATRTCNGLNEIALSFKGELLMQIDPAFDRADAACLRP